MKIFYRSLILMLAITLVSISFSAAFASPAAQSMTTPTPGADGRIIWIVQSGESCELISSVTGVPVTQLRTLNRLDENCTLQIGKEILIGFVDPNFQVTSDAPQVQVTSTPMPTPTQEIGQAVICVLLFDDVNGDAFRQETEGVIPGGAVSVSGTSGQYSKTATTTNSPDPVCFENALSGPYTISIGLPEGYNPTTQQNYSLNIIFGEQVYVDFGAQISGVADVVGENEPAPASSFNLLAVLGIGLIVLAIGLGIFTFFYTRKQPNY